MISATALGWMMNGLTIASFFMLLGIFGKLMRWGGIVDNRLDNLEEWNKSQDIEIRASHSKQGGD